MRFVERVRRIISANINDLLERAEKPEKVLNQLLREMEESSAEAKEKLAAAMANERRLQSHLEEARKAVAQWEERARTAVERGEDDLAREALKRKRLRQEMVQVYERELGLQSDSVKGLRASVEALRQKLEEAKVRKRVLLTRYEAARAETAVRAAVGRAVDLSAFQAFERLADRIEDMELRAQAMLEISAEELEKKFEEPERDAEIEAELAELKAQVSQPQLPGPQSEPTSGGAPSP